MRRPSPPLPSCSRPRISTAGCSADSCTWTRCSSTSPRRGSADRWLYKRQPSQGSSCFAMGASSAPTPNPSDPLTRRRPQSRPWLQIGNRSSRSRAAMEPSPRSTSTPRSIEPTRSTARGRLASAPLRTALLAATAMIVASLSGCCASPPQIIQLIPNRGSVGVAADAAITVGFDRPVATGSIAGRFSVKPPMPSCDLAAAFSAGPDAACRVVWLGGDTGFTLLHPRALFAPHRTYTFTLAGGISDPNGVVNSVDHQWSITSGQAPLIRAVDPPDGSTGVPVDTPISVTFSTSMDAAATDAAIQLSPAVPGTRGVRNRLDTSRFVMLPGRTLESGVTYRLTIARTAADSHLQPLVAGATATFTTAGLSPGPHAVVLARGPGEGATTVLLSPLAPAQPGEPIATEAVLVAPRCERAGCGDAVMGGPLYTYGSAVLSAGGPL